MSFKEFDTVVMKADMPSHRLKRDGSSLEQITKVPEYRNGNLYWIQ